CATNDVQSRSGAGILQSGRRSQGGSEMKVREVMSKNLVYCGPEASLQEVAQLMRDNDCGEIPIVESSRTRKLIGVITDRDIVCTALGGGSTPTPDKTGR